MKFVNKVSFLFVLTMFLQGSISCAAGQDNPQGFCKDHQNSNPNRVSKISTALDALEKKLTSEQNANNSSGAGPCINNPYQLSCGMHNLKISSPVLKASSSAAASEVMGTNVFDAIEKETLDNAEFCKIKASDNVTLLSSQSSSSNEKKRKIEYSPRKINQGIVVQINQRINRGSTPSQPKRDIINLRTVDVAAINALSPDSAEFVSKKIKALKGADDNVKTVIVEALAVKHVHSVVGSEVDSITRNDMLLPVYKTRSHTLSLINESGVHLSDRVVAYASAVDTQHVMVLGEKRDRSGNLVNIAGAHILQCYKKAGVCLYKPKGILGLDENVMGIETIEGNIGKTVYVDASTETFISNLKNSRLIAIDQSKSGMSLCQISSHQFVGSYKDADNKLYCKTLFPVLTVTDGSLNADGSVAIGSLVNFRPSGDVDHASKQKISISKSSFDAIMNDPIVKPFVAQKDAKVFVKEITQALEQCCSAELTAFGMQKFPSKIYGIKKIN